MRHLRKGRKLGRVARLRRALLKTMAVSLVEHGRIKTTLPKARELKPFIEKAITRAKNDSMESIRILRKLFPEKTAKLLIKKWAPLFKERSGGYTRIVKLINRKSDASPMAYIEFIERPKEEKVVKEKVKKEKKIAKKDIKSDVKGEKEK